MTKPLKDTQIAILVANGFEQSELDVPLRELRKAGARVDIVSPEDEQVKGWQHDHWGDSFPVDVPLSQAKPQDYDALVLPGGQMNPDFLRANDTAVAFVGAFIDAEKTVAAICHGPWTLINADAVRGRRVTSYESIRVDLENAGAMWEDEPVIVDHNLITSRKPDDLDAFCSAIISQLAGETTMQSAS